MRGMKMAVWLTSAALAATFFTMAGGDALAQEAASAGKSRTLNERLEKLRYQSDTARGSIYGQVNKGFLVYDDGNGALLYPLVDNDNSSTRAGLEGELLVEGQTWFGGKIEFEWEPYSTGDVNRLNRNEVELGAPVWGLRKLETWVKTTDYGTLSLGQGSATSDGSAEKDLSGTGLVGYSSVADSAGGQLFAFSGMPGLSTVRVGNGFGNLDGLGRILRASYQSPKFSGFSLGGTIGTDLVSGISNLVKWDVTGSYGDTLGDFKLVGAAAYSFKGNDTSLFSGSASVLHEPTGLSLTVAGGREDRPTRTPNYVYGKFGYQRDFFSFGRTALSVDVYSGQNFNSTGSESLSVGFQAVQNIPDYSTEVYLGVRWYDFDERAASYKTSWGILTGARFRF